jgi:hypothetical protein
LEEHVVFLRLVVMVRILDAQYIVAEPRDHEELLIERVHVTDAAEVLDANMASGRLLLFDGLYLPAVVLVSPPSWILVELFHVVENYCQILQTVLAESR